MYMVMAVYEKMHMKRAYKIIYGKI